MIQFIAFMFLPITYGYPRLDLKPAGFYKALVKLSALLNHKLCDGSEITKECHF